MGTLIESLIAAHIVVGSLFIFVGSLGLVRLPDLMSRLHAQSKATTLGVGGCLVASMIHFGALQGRVSVQEVLIILFLFLTSPVTAHFLSKAYLHTQADPEADLPQAQGDSDWSTFGTYVQSTMRPNNTGGPPSDEGEASA
jgi:multicomponent K+:H+ antiporter subunit G